MYEKEKIRWFHEMSQFSKNAYYSNLIVCPGLIILFVYQYFFIELNVFWTYLILDIIITLVVRASERKRIMQERIEQEDENSGRTMIRIRKLLDEMKEEEAEKAGKKGTLQNR